jgi:hypothetical protein
VKLIERAVSEGGELVELMPPTWTAYVSTATFLDGDGVFGGQVS